MGISLLDSMALNDLNLNRKAIAGKLHYDLNENKCISSTNCSSFFSKSSKDHLCAPWKAFYSDSAGLGLPSRSNGVRPDAIGECQAMMVG
jgi:hypothetical protein